MPASVVIPAYNESQTVANVIAPLLGHPLVAEILVVSDGSTDDTARRAAAAGAHVIELRDNCGKATALAVGVNAARSDVILFIDADVTGLNADMVTRLIAPVLVGECEMFVGICDRRVYWLNRLLRYTPIISGERALRRHVWEHVPPSYQRNFQVEIALNYFAKMAGARMTHRVMPGLAQVKKEKKRGLWPGLWQRTLMIRDIVVVAFRLYVVHNTRLLLGAAPAAEPLADEERGS
jgi:polyprenyl-phospho-N-acetylgalactosaminyl synthase